MEDDIISVIDAANQLETNKQYLFKLIKRLNVKAIKQKSSAHKGQAISYISKKDFELITKEISFSKTNINNQVSAATTQIEQGVFYLIQLEPEHDPGRFKLGFATNIEERLRSHRCSAPYAVVVKTWPCHSLWEKTAIDCVTQNCEKIHTEVFRTTDISGVKIKCDQFFNLMPNPESVMR